MWWSLAVVTFLTVALLAHTGYLEHCERAKRKRVDSLKVRSHPPTPSQDGHSWAYQQAQRYYEEQRRERQEQELREWLSYMDREENE